MAKGFDIKNASMPHIHLSVRFWMVMLALASCFGGWTMGGQKAPAIDKDTEKIQMVVDGLQMQKDNLQELYDNMQFYLDETDRLKEDSDDVLNEFPVYMYLEDKILYVDNLLKTDFKDYDMTNISYAQSKFISSASYGGQSANLSGESTTDGSTADSDTTDGTETDGDASSDATVDGTTSNGDAQKTMDLYEITVSMTFNEATYPEVKKLLDYGLTSSQRYVVDSMTIGYNEDSGLLTGTFSFSTYFIWGQEDKTYEFPEDVTDGISGTNRANNLFNSRGSR